MSGNINFNGWLNDDGSENYKCRAWVNFNGVGTVAIRASGNVSSITDNGTGDYTISFTTVLPDTNYCVVTGLTPETTGSGVNILRPRPGESLTNNIRFNSGSYVVGLGNTLVDVESGYLAIFR